MLCSEKVLLATVFIVFVIFEEELVEIVLFPSTNRDLMLKHWRSASGLCNIGILDRSVNRY